MKVEVSTFIKAPVEQVFAFVTDFENGPKWLSAQREARTSGGPLRVGLTVTEVAVFMGRRIETTSTVIDYESNRRVVFSLDSAAARGEVHRTFEPVREGTRFTENLELHWRALSRLAGPIADAMVRRLRRRDVQRLKHLLESEHRHRA